MQRPKEAAERSWQRGNESDASSFDSAKAGAVVSSARGQDIRVAVAGNIAHRGRGRNDSLESSARDRRHIRRDGGRGQGRRRGRGRGKGTTKAQYEETMRSKNSQVT